MDAASSNAEQLYKVKRPAAVPAIAPGKLREALERDFAATHGRSPQPRQLDWMVMLSRWAAWAALGGTTIDRSIPQIVKALGLPRGPTVHATRQRYRNQIYRTFGYLEAMGWIEGVCEAPRAADGRGRCILVRITAGVAQSVRAALRGVRRWAAALPKPSSWLGLASPLRARTDVGVKSGVSVNREGDGARTRPALVDAHGPPGSSTVSAAPIRSTSTAGSEKARAVAVALRAWRESCPDTPPRLSKRGAMLIERYCGILDRLAGRDGYGASWLAGQIEMAFDPYCGSALDLGRLPWDRGAPPGGGAPRSLGYFVRLLRRHARRARKQARRG